MSDPSNSSPPSSETPSKGGILASRLNPISQLMPIEELQDFLKTLRHRASLLVTFLIWIASAGASLFFFWQNEADWYAPMLMGWGLWLLWRIDHGGWIRFSLFILYLMSDLFFLIDRAFPHPVWRSGAWSQSDFSLGLAICSATLSLALLISILDTYKRFKKSRIYRKVMKRWIHLDTPLPSPQPASFSIPLSSPPSSSPPPHLRSSSSGQTPSKEEIPALKEDE